MHDISFFEGELNLIVNPQIKRMTRQALEDAPEYIWSAVSSITGKYHPPEDNEPGGLCCHMRKTAWVGYRLFDNFLQDTDIAISAGILHDMAHRGLDDEPSEDIEVYNQHGLLACNKLMEYETELIDGIGSNMIWKRIYRCVRSHMGRWGEVKPKSMIEVLFHCADVAASTRGLVGIPFLDGQAFPEMSIEEIVSRRQYFIPDDEGQLVFAFGKKHKDDRLAAVMAKDPGYLRWMLDQGTLSPGNTKGFPAYALDQVRGVYGG